MSNRPSIASKGFTLAELMIAVLMLGLLSGVLVGGLAGLLPTGRQEAAIAKARVLNAARCSYALLVPGAEEQWEAAGSDGARLLLLQEARVLESGSESLLSSPGGYALSLEGSLRQLTLLRLSGAVVDYASP